MTTIYITGVESVLSTGEVSGEPDRNLTSILSVSKLPEYVRSEYPALSTFVKEYYTYLERMESVSDASGLDSASDKYLERYKDMVLRGFGTPKFMDMRKFISNSKEMFKLKGTDEAFKYFFRAYFGEEIEIKPSTYLVASGGDISGATFFHCEVMFGTLEPLVELTIVNSAGDFKILVDTAIFVDEEVYRITFRVPRGFKSNIGDICLGYDADHNKTFQGIILPSPSRMVVVNPGKYWKRGQLLTFPAIDDGDNDIDNDTATLARVRTVDTNTGIASLEIIQHGYPHYTDQSYTVSPFEFRPSGSIIVYAQTVSEYNAGVPSSYNHVLNISDNIDPLSDAVFGELTDGTTWNIVSVNSTPVTKSVSNDTNTYERWLESRATVRIEMSSIGREFQVYRTNDSLLSDENTKLHDNLYYQAFAYSLISNQDLQEYKGSIDLIHPAGMKFHALMTKIFEADETGNINFSIVAAVDTFFWNETIEALDDQSKHILKALATDPYDVDTFTTYVNMLEAIQSFQVIKPLTDSIDVPDTQAKHLLKPFVASHLLYDGVTSDIDVVSALDAINSKQVVKPLFDYPEAIDAIQSFQVVKPLNDSIVPPTDVEVRLVIKPTTDSIPEPTDAIQSKQVVKPFLTVGHIAADGITTDTDLVLPNEAIQSFQVIKPATDSVPTPADAIQSFQVIKPTTDSIPEPTDAIHDFQVYKPTTDSIPEPTDAIHDFQVIKSVNDSIPEPTDAIQSFQAGKVLADTFSTGDYLAILTSSTYSDSINTSDGTPVLEAESRYNITGYAVNSVDNYFYSGITLTIS